MKRLILLTLTTIPLFAFTMCFRYCDYEYDCGDNHWCDEYWCYDYEYCDGYWVYYPYGYYCVYYVWWYPWWWDWYWWRCRWCHYFDWHFFCAGFYIVWYEDGCWWWRPRYGRWVKYKLPYTYAEFRYKARTYGIQLPEKPSREIILPYKEKEIQRLTKEKDPQLYARLQKEYKTGNLEKMEREYKTRVKKEIAIKNEQYKRTKAEYPINEKPIEYRHERTIKKKYKDLHFDQTRKKDNGTYKREMPRSDIEKKSDHKEGYDKRDVYQLEQEEIEKERYRQKIQKMPIRKQPPEKGSEKRTTKDQIPQQLGR